jgi:hypothetical protein
MLAKFSPQMASFPLEHGFPAEPTTWKNFYRFLPLATYFGEKVAKKVRGKLGLHRTELSNNKIKEPRLQLWRDERVKELLVAQKMKLGTLTDTKILESFLRRSQEANFTYGDQWARIVSLECALQAGARARKI